MRQTFASFLSRFTSIFVFILFGIFVLTPITTFAGNGRSCWACNWYPIITIGAGGISSSKLARSQSFQIVNPIVDSFYYYTPNQGTQTNGILDGFIGFEWRLGTKAGLMLQGGLGYDQAASFTVKGSLIQGADVGSEDKFTYQYNVILRQLLLEGKLLASFASYYHPYLFAGVGAAFDSASNFSTNVPYYLTLTRAYSSNNSTEFSYSVGFGIDMDLDAIFRIGIGYRFADYGNISLGKAVIDTTPVSGTLSQSNVYTNEILAQLTCNLS